MLNANGFITIDYGDVYYVYRIKDISAINYRAPETNSGLAELYIYMPDLEMPRQFLGEAAKEIYRGVMSFLEENPEMHLGHFKELAKEEA